MKHVLPPGLAALASAAALLAASPTTAVATQSGLASLHETRLPDRARATGIAALPDGGVAIAASSFASGRDRYTVLRYTADGDRDRRYGRNGVSRGPGFLHAITSTGDGGVVAVGTIIRADQPRCILVRLAPDGSRLASFAGRGYLESPPSLGACSARGVGLQPDGSILVVGGAYPSGSTAERPYAARFTASGELDQSFGKDGMAWLSRAGLTGDASGVVVRPDGTIAVAATTTTSHGHPITTVAFLTSAGRPWSECHASSVDRWRTMRARASGIAAAADGALYVVGAGEDAHGVPGRLELLRYRAGGHRDLQFGRDGRTARVITYAEGLPSVAVDGQGRAVVAWTELRRGAPVIAVWRFTARGALDRSFNGGRGVAYTGARPRSASAAGVAVTLDGTIAAAGSAYVGLEGGDRRVGVLLARYRP